MTDQNPVPIRRDVTRRHFFRECGVGVGKIALAGLLTDAFSPGVRSAPPSIGAAIRWRRGRRTSPPKAKRVIHLFMAGAPSQLDLFDPKPELTRLEGKPLPPSVIGGQRYAFIRPDAAVLGPRFTVRPARPVRAPSSRRCCRIWPRWWTTSASSSR